MRNSLIMKVTFWMVVVGILVSGGYLYIRHQKLYPSTDDAYIKANTIQIAAQVSGPIATVYTQNHALVTKGQLLFTIDPQPFQIALEQAEANLQNIKEQTTAQGYAVATAKSLVAEREAEAIVTRKNTNRALKLVVQRLLPIAAGDEARSKLAIATAALDAAHHQLDEASAQLGQVGAYNARIRAAEAALAQAKLNLEHTRILAPNTGYIVNFDLRQGNVITAQQPLFAIIENNEWWVDANFKETDLTRINEGQPAVVKVDIYPQKSFNGKVISISSGSGAAFALLPPENATGNWVKVTQRFTVRIKIVDYDDKYPLRVGASSTVTIDTH